MRTFLLLAMILNGALAVAQPIGFQSVQRTSGAVGVVPGQTARLNVVYPRSPAPILQVLCSATLAIADDQGRVLKSSTVSQLIAGKSVSLDLNADTELPGGVRTQIHAFSIAQTGCNLPATLEIIDNATQRTVIVIGSETTYPVSQSVLPPRAVPVGSPTIQ